jgi:hypothetical protein
MYDIRTSASKQYRGVVMEAEFWRDTGCLRIAEDGVVVAEWFAPHSWFAVASVGSFSSGGTRPNSADLLRLLDEHRAYRAGTEDFADIAADPS